MRPHVVLSYDAVDGWDACGLMQGASPIVRMSDAVSCRMRDIPEWLPTTVFQRFCAAIVYSKRKGAPDAEELDALNNVLADIASLAIRGNVTPERMLIELKKGWTHVCNREPSPDMDDPEWSRLLPLALDAFARMRDGTA